VIAPATALAACPEGNEYVTGRRSITRAATDPSNGRPRHQRLDDEVRHQMGQGQRDEHGHRRASASPIQHDEDECDDQPHCTSPADDTQPDHHRISNRVVMCGQPHACGGIPFDELTDGVHWTAMRLVA
jgi:hypothetical protein